MIKHTEPNPVSRNWLLLEFGFSERDELRGIDAAICETAPCVERDAARLQ
jgi:hypothetical protein